MIKITAIPELLHRPVSHRLRFRRSTALMVLLFIGLGALWLEVRTPSTASAGSKALDQAITQGLKPGESLIITRPESTTTTVAPAPSTTRPTTSTSHPPTSTTQPGPSGTQSPPAAHGPTTTRFGETPPSATAPSSVTTPDTTVPSTPAPAATDVPTTVGHG